MLRLATSIRSQSFFMTPSSIRPTSSCNQTSEPIDLSIRPLDQAVRHHVPLKDRVNERCQC